MHMLKLRNCIGVYGYFTSHV